MTDWVVGCIVDTTTYIHIIDMSVNGALNWVVHSQNTLCSRVQVGQTASENTCSGPTIYTHTSGAMYGGVPHLLLSFLSFPMCLNTVDRPKSDILTVSAITTLLHQSYLQQPHTTTHQLHPEGCSQVLYLCGPLPYCAGTPTGHQHDENRQQTTRWF